MKDAASSERSRVSDVIVVPRIAGHRLSYVRLLVTRAAECGVPVELLAPRGTRESPEYDLHLGEHSSHITLNELPSFSAASLQTVFNERPGATFIFPDGDDSLPLLATRKLRPIDSRVSVLMMRPRGQAARMGKRLFETVAKTLMRSIARSAKGVEVFSLVPSTTPSLRAGEIRDPIEYAPGAALLDWPRVDASVAWFGIVGAITSRKNIRLVALALAQLDAKVGLVVAGASEMEEAKIAEWLAPLRAAGRPVIRINRRLSDEELDTVIAAVDVAVIAHTNDGPSGIMGKADIAGKRVLAAGAPTLRRELRANPDLGVWTKLNVVSLSRGARTILTMPSPRESNAGKGSRDMFARALRQEDEKG